MTATATTYKFRAESPCDLCNFIRLLADEGFRELHADCTEHGGVHCRITLDMDLEAVRDLMRQVQYGHVMLQTVQSEGSFTSDRNPTVV